MPRGTIEILEATKKKIVLKIKVGKDYKVTLPVQVRNLLEPYETKILTLEDPA